MEKSERGTEGMKKTIKKVKRGKDERKPSVVSQAQCITSLSWVERERDEWKKKKTRTET